MSKKYVFVYVGGTKGDMVVRFLNGVEPDISFDRANKTEPQELGCVNWLKLIRDTRPGNDIVDTLHYKTLNRTHSCS